MYSFPKYSRIRLYPAMAASLVGDLYIVHRDTIASEQTSWRIDGQGKKKYGMKILHTHKCDDWTINLADQTIQLE